MDKISKVAKVTGNGNWKELYKFEVEFENGDVGTLYRKTNEAKVNIGEQYNYTINDKGSIKIVNPNYANGGATPHQNNSGNSNNKTGEQIARMNCVTNAIAFCKDSECSEEHIVKIADFFFNYVMGDCCEIKKTQTPELQVTNDDTPF